MTVLTKETFTNAIRQLGISGSAVCIHSSMRSFQTEIECGIPGLIDAFLSEGCTIMVPTFSDQYETKPIPEYMPDRNGVLDYSFFFEQEYPETEPFTTASNEMTVEDMGIFNQMVLEQPDRIRGNHPLNSFTALGKEAEKLVSCQSPKEVYAPLRKLCEMNGFVLLMGTGLDSATAIHYAEQAAGRSPFIRWSKDENGTPIPVYAGSCSDGFENFRQILKPVSRQIQVGRSIWTCIKAADLVTLCREEIRRNPQITHCKDPDCDRCRDAIAGGPALIL